MPIRKQNLNPFPGSYKPSLFSLEKPSEAPSGVDSVFLTSFDIYKCEEPNPSVAIHTPFLSLTVGLAAMVHEPSIVALWPSINDSILELRKKPPENHILISCYQLQSTSSAASGQCWQIMWHYRLLHIILLLKDTRLPNSQDSATAAFWETKSPCGISTG